MTMRRKWPTVILASALLLLVYESTRGKIPLKLGNRRGISENIVEPQTDISGITSSLSCAGAPHSKHFYSTGKPIVGFIGVGMLFEQQTKARLHFSEIMTMAKAEGRTLILPMCQNGTIGSSAYAGLPLCTYFDLKKLGEFVDWVSESYFFEKFSSSFSTNPSFVFLGSPCNANIAAQRTLPFIGNVTSKNRTGLVSRNLRCLKCSLKAFKYNFPTINGSLVVATKLTSRPCFQRHVHNSALNHLRYSDKLQRVATSFAQKFLGNRFVAIQWRIEYTLRRNLNSRGIQRCVKGLENSVKGAIHEYNLSGVFLATDAPHGKHLSSMSIQGLGMDRKALLGNITNLLSGKLKSALWTQFDPGFYSLDSGIRGILDKLVCAQSQVFLYPPPICFRSRVKEYVASSYTREIIEMRKSLSRVYGTPDEALTMPWKL